MTLNTPPDRPPPFTPTPSHSFTAVILGAAIAMCAGLAVAIAIIVLGTS